MIKGIASNLPITDDQGKPTGQFLSWISSVVSALNGVEVTANAAVPSTRRVVSSGGLKGGAALSADVGITLYRVSAPVAQLPTNGNAPGDWAFAVDGRKPGESAGAGTGIPVFFSGGQWFTTAGAQVTA